MAKKRANKSWIMWAVIGNNWEGGRLPIEVL